MPREIYRKEGFDPNTPLVERQGEAFVRTRENKHQPQYYFQTIEEAATVTHVITGRSTFYYELETEEDEEETIKQGGVAYTRGFLWSSTDPNWRRTGGQDNVIIRCRIELSPGTQVVVDRSPYGQNRCNFDDKRMSLFPDVLLSPGKFQITSVKHYRRKDGDDDDQSNVGHDAGITLVEPMKGRPSSTVWSDEEYAAKVLTNDSVDPVKDFIDVRLDVVKMMRFEENMA